MARAARLFGWTLISSSIVLAHGLGLGHRHIRSQTKWQIGAPAVLLPSLFCGSGHTTSHHADEGGPNGKRGLLRHTKLLLTSALAATIVLLPVFAPASTFVVRADETGVTTRTSLADRVQRLEDTMFTKDEAKEMEARTRTEAREMEARTRTEAREMEARTRTEAREMEIRLYSVTFVVLGFMYFQMEARRAEDKAEMQARRAEDMATMKSDNFRTFIVAVSSVIATALSAVVPALLKSN